LPGRTAAYTWLMQPSRPRKVVVAMSGGVDSSVAAALLLRQGYQVIGVFMRLGTPPGVGADTPDAATDACAAGASGGGHKQGCCSVLDAHDARRVAGVLGIPFYVVNFQDEFGRIIDYFVSEYNRGRTPNPCVRCNQWLKFGRLSAYARAVGADCVASGHYARIGVDPVTREPALFRGLDARKDQSYVLFGMQRDVLAHTLLPIGQYQKDQVRAIAQELKLPVYNKPDSQEICFVPDQDYAALVRRRTPEAFGRGQFVTVNGQVIGEHAGHQQFTIGQRKGLGVAVGRPVYVVDIDPGRNRVVLGEPSALLRQSLIARQVNLLSDRISGAGSAGLCCRAKIRYNHAPQPAIVRMTGDDEIRVDFEHAQTAVTPGQAVVVYDDDLVLGGGWIERAL